MRPMSEASNKELARYIQKGVLTPSNLYEVLPDKNYFEILVDLNLV